MSEIDYSSIQQPPITQPSQWKAPRHVYFGGRNRDTGEMNEEPVYEYQEYPRMMYRLEGQKIIATVVNSDDELAALGDGWEKNPAAFGHLSAPSFAEAQAMKNQPLAHNRSPGRPPKSE